jgi:hypothetical protein
MHRLRMSNVGYVACECGMVTYSGMHGYKVLSSNQGTPPPPPITALSPFTTSSFSLILLQFPHPLQRPLSSLHILIPPSPPSSLPLRHYSSLLSSSMHPRPSLHALLIPPFHSLTALSRPLMMISLHYNNIPTFMPSSRT